MGDWSCLTYIFTEEDQKNINDFIEEYKMNMRRNKYEKKYEPIFIESKKKNL